MATNSGQRDLPLFTWTPQTAEVIPFPANRRVGKARRVAEVLNSKRGRDADAYWLRTVETLLGQMDRAGVSREAAEREAQAFFDAVQAELNRMAYASRGEYPGGAA